MIYLKWNDFMFIENPFVFTIFGIISCKFLQWIYWIFVWHEIIRCICKPIILKGFSIEFTLRINQIARSIFKSSATVFSASIIPRLKDSKFSIIQHDRHMYSYLNPVRYRRLEWNLKISQCFELYNLGLTYPAIVTKANNK